MLFEIKSLEYVVIINLCLIQGEYLFNDGKVQGNQLMEVLIVNTQQDL